MIEGRIKDWWTSSRDQEYGCIQNFFSGGGTRTIHIHSAHNTVVEFDLDYCVQPVINATIAYSYYCAKISGVEGGDSSWDWEIPGPPPSVRNPVKSGLIAFTGTLTVRNVRWTMHYHDRACTCSTITTEKNDKLP